MAMVRPTQLAAGRASAHTVVSVSLLHRTGLAVGVLVIALVAIGIGLLLAIGVVGVVAVFEVLVLPNV